VEVVRLKRESEEGGVGKTATRRASYFVVTTQYYLDDQMKDDEACRSYSAHGRREKYNCDQKSERKIQVYL
jgi:hypothetical protein